MSLSSLTCTTLALAAGLALPPQAKSTWKPNFDYTNLQPTDEEYWQPLIAAKVVLEGALDVAAETEGTSVQLLSARLDPQGGDPVWRLELFVGDDRPKRVNLRVSANEPKVLKRVELRSMAADEEGIWQVMRDGEIKAKNAIAVGIKSVQGDKEIPATTDARARTLAFRTDDGKPYWDLELMFTESKNGHLRRYGLQIDTQRPVAKQMILRDRFVGEPLRKDKPMELPNGMLAFDFQPGDGPVLTADSRVKVNYWMWLLDNTKIHDTWKSKLPETFLVSEAPLKGMTEGMIGMRVGGKRKLCIPYEKAFGERGNELAPPKAMIVCDVSIEELISDDPRDTPKEGASDKPK